LQSLAQTSPSMDSLDAALKAGVSEIETVVEARVLAEVTALQTAINIQQKRFEDADTARSVSKPKADQADQQWFDCVTEEGSATGNLEKATEQYQTAVQEALKLAKKETTWTRGQQLLLPMISSSHVTPSTAIVTMTSRPTLRVCQMNKLKVIRQCRQRKASIRPLQRFV